MKLATLCYVRANDMTLMLHRVKKEHDMHAGKWNGLGGKVEAGESPDKRMTSFLGKLRQTVGKDCPIHILPLEHHAGQWPAASDRDLEIWTRTLSSLRDRQLSVRRIAAS